MKGGSGIYCNSSRVNHHVGKKVDCIQAKEESLVQGYNYFPLHDYFK